MPLSEDEQRILHQIEQQFYATDPGLARTVGETSIYRHHLRGLRWAVLLFVVGVAVLALTLTTSFVLSFGGFLIMLGAVLWAERCVRKMGRAGIQQLTGNLRGSPGMREYLQERSNRMKDRLHRDDDR